MLEFVIARNPDVGSSLPYLIRLPLGPRGIALKTRETWPRATKVYCHRADEWPDDLEVLERIPTRSCVRRGAAVDLVLDRAREHRSQFVFTQARGREVIFWQSARTAKQARPAVSVPTARAAGRILEIVVDAHERYAWNFANQQATTVRRALPAGDYAVEVDGSVIASVERKSLADLVSTLTSGKLRYLLADLATLPRSALAVEDRWSSVFKLDRVRPAVVADGLAEAQVRFPTVPIVFCETRQLAQEWTYRFLGAALAQHHEDSHGVRRAAELPEPGDALPAAAPVHPSVRASPPSSGPTPNRPPVSVVRAWALANGIGVSDRGRLRPEIWERYFAAHPGAEDTAANGA